jgi:hypothetical protein
MNQGLAFLGCEAASLETRAVDVSRAVLASILSQMRVWVSELEAEELYRELIAYFGLAGAVDECRALESAWEDPYGRREVEEFIKAWLARRRKLAPAARAAYVV